MDNDFPDFQVLPDVRRPVTIRCPASGIAAIAAWLASLALMILGSVDMLSWLRAWALWLAILAGGLTLSAVLAHTIWTAREAFRTGVQIGEAQALERLAEITGKAVPFPSRHGRDSAPV